MNENCPKCGFEFKDYLRNKVEKELKIEFKKEKEKQVLDLNDEIEKISLENLKLKQEKENEKELLKTQLRQEFLNEFSKEKLDLEKDKINLEGKISQMAGNHEREKELAVSLALQKQNSKRDAEDKLELTKKDLQIKEMQKMIEELEQKSKKESQQAQGEVGEILIENTLKLEYPLDKIEEVAKGQNGADVCHYVCDKSDNELGLIYIESKNAKKFSASWVKKLKDDMQMKKASYGVLVTTDIPENYKAFEEDDLFICGFHDYLLAVKLIRGRILELSKLAVIENNRSSEKDIYNYVTGKEFAQWVRGMRDYFIEQKKQLDVDKRQADKSFAIREKQLEKVQSAHMSLAGHFKGLGHGSDFKLLDQATEE